MRRLPPHPLMANLERLLQRREDIALGLELVSNIQIVSRFGYRAIDARIYVPYSRTSSNRVPTRPKVTQTNPVTPNIG